MSTVYHRPADPSGDDSYVRPLFADRCQAGFPSPATDYAEQELDLNSYCISRPAATFFLRASGESMNQAGVQNGDLLVVDRAEKPQHGDISDVTPFRKPADAVAASQSEYSLVQYKNRTFP